MTETFASITEMPGALLSPEQYGRYLHRYAFGLQVSGLLERPRRLLEVGSGAGGGLAAWHEAATERAGLAVGLEFVESSLQVARANLGVALPLVGGDAMRLPFAAASFDAIACFEVIYYLADLSAFLRESRRALAPGGKLILCWSNPDWTEFAPGRHSGHYPSLVEVAMLLDQAGYAEASFYGAFPSTQATRKARWVNRARQIALRTGLVAALGEYVAPLMRAAYGTLTPLPAQLHVEEIAGRQVAASVLAPDARDAVHRVLYAVANQRG